ncbi:unnamed protein product [Soboliphyme baturini]|uniref:Uncharacterized protein n=1 Tax=Soboliphyme baturini TaxID=241478 RepID=A0A183IA68_9BILA|nr:unnamed protein product [Soboliphyme baturini]
MINSPEHNRSPFEANDFQVLHPGAKVVPRMISLVNDLPDSVMFELETNFPEIFALFEKCFVIRSGNSVDVALKIAKGTVVVAKSAVENLILTITARRIRRPTLSVSNGIHCHAWRKAPAKKLEVKLKLMNGPALQEGQRFPALLDPRSALEAFNMRFKMNKLGLDYSENLRPDVDTSQSAQVDDDDGDDDGLIVRATTELPAEEPPTSSVRNHDTSSNSGTDGSSDSGKEGNDVQKSS